MNSQIKESIEKKIKRFSFWALVMGAIIPGLVGHGFYADKYFNVSICVSIIDIALMTVFAYQYRQFYSSIIVEKEKKTSSCMFDLVVFFIMVLLSLGYSLSDFAEENYHILISGILYAAGMVPMERTWKRYKSLN